MLDLIIILAIFDLLLSKMLLFPSSNYLSLFEMLSNAIFHKMIISRKKQSSISPDHFLKHIKCVKLLACKKSTKNSSWRRKCGQLFLHNTQDIYIVNGLSAIHCAPLKLDNFIMKLLVPMNKKKSSRITASIKNIYPNFLSLCLSFIVDNFRFWLFEVWNEK